MLVLCHTCSVLLMLINQNKLLLDSFRAQNRLLGLRSRQLRGSIVSVTLNVKIVGKLAGMVTHSHTVGSICRYVFRIKVFDFSESQLERLSRSIFRFINLLRLSLFDSRVHLMISIS